VKTSLAIVFALLIFSWDEALLRERLRAGRAVGAAGVKNWEAKLHDR
jgi:hypothetical protein